MLKVNTVVVFQTIPPGNECYRALQRKTNSVRKFSHNTDRIELVILEAKVNFLVIFGYKGAT